MNKFLVFEGPEGAGKTTQIQLLKARLIQRGITPIITKEPGGTPAADAIRAVILDPKLEINPLTEFLLYCASRAQHVNEVIKPALEKNKLVISDRFYAASIAYQGYGRGLELSFINDLTARVTQGLSPNLTILLDIDPEKGLKRVANRGQKDRLELADLSFHRRVRQGFLTQAGNNPNWVVIDAAQTETEIANAVWQSVKKALMEVNDV